MDEQLAAICRIDVLRGGVDGLKRGYSRFTNTPEVIVIEGEKAMIVWHIQAANAKGVPIDAKGANYFIVKNGKITYMANFHDSIPFKPFTEQNLEAEAVQNR